jgi:hypothetical protein
MIGSFLKDENSVTVTVTVHGSCTEQVTKYFFMCLIGTSLQTKYLAFNTVNLVSINLDYQA